MDDTTVVHLLRHGEVENPEGVLYGRLLGYHLSEDGALMAKAVAKWLTGRDVTALFSSPLERAQETAAPIAETFGLTVITDDRLMEAANNFEGARYQLERARFGLGAPALNRPSTWVLLRNPFRPSWGEPYQRIAARMLAAATAAREAARGHEAVCVSHQLPIWVARRKVEGVRLWHHPARRQCALASLTSFTYEGDRLVSVSYREPAVSIQGDLNRRPSVPGA
ncbi:MAG TPA: histidine phosphatase family protein [Streptosporangiaceae bacterium]|jgi:broad specificity phosphatase PhoE|nr:histidine phosphatase family protein [Streptosporangiaceae bacterium]